MINKVFTVIGGLLLILGVIAVLSSFDSEPFDLINAAFGLLLSISGIIFIAGSKKNEPIR